MHVHHPSSGFFYLLERASIGRARIARSCWVPKRKKIKNKNKNCQILMRFRIRGRGWVPCHQSLDGNLCWAQRRWRRAWPLRLPAAPPAPAPRASTHHFTACPPPHHSPRARSRGHHGSASRSAPSPMVATARSPGPQPCPSWCPWRRPPHSRAGGGPGLHDGNG